MTIKTGHIAFYTLTVEDFTIDQEIASASLHLHSFSNGVTLSQARKVYKAVGDRIELPIPESTPYYDGKWILFSADIEAAIGKAFGLPCHVRREKLHAETGTNTFTIEFPID